MKLREILDMRSLNPVCILDDVEHEDMLVAIDSWDSAPEFWLTEKALDQEVKFLLNSEKWPGYLCVILEDDDD